MKQVREDLTRSIDSLLNHVDFRRIRTAMLALGWKWRSSNRTPSIKLLRDAARSVLNEVADPHKTTDFSMSGGFCARRENDHLELTFDIEHVWSVK